MRRTLRPYQAEAVQHILDNPNAAIFMEMRLGKTLVCIRALSQAKLAGCVLVVAPMVGLWAWKRELGLEGEVPAVLTGKPEERMRTACTQTWNLINYEGLRAVPQLLQSNWSAIILDESRRIANPKAAITKVLQSYKNPDTRRIILSGNPAPEGPQEFFEQMRWLDGRFLGCENFWQFRYCFFVQLLPYEFVPKPTAIARIKKAVHARAFMLTRKDAGITTTKIYERRVVKLCAPARKIYKQVSKEFAANAPSGPLSTKWVPVQYMWLQQIASGFIGEEKVDDAKVKELVSLLQGELASESVVVWFRFNSGLREVKRVLDSARIPNERILGEIKPVDRELAIDRFRAGKVRVLLCQIKAAKEAIDLSTSSTAIYFSNSHSLDERIQSEDRILNPVKKEPLLYIDLVAADTVDEDVVDLLVEKKIEARFFLTKLLEKLNARQKSKNK